MALLTYVDGLETGTTGVDGGVVGSLSYAAEALRPGATYSRKVPAGSQHYQQISLTPAQVPILVWRGYVRVEGLPGATLDLFDFLAETVTKCELRLTTAGLIRLEVPGGSSADGPMIVDSEWHYVDVKVDLSANPWVVSWAVDGVEQDNAGIASTASSLNRVRVGNILGTSVLWYSSDMVATDDETAYPIGRGQVTRLLADSVGTHNDDTKFREHDNSTIDADSWQRIDDMTLPTSAGDSVKQPTGSSTAYLEFNIVDLPEGQEPVNGVRAVMVGHADGSSVGGDPSYEVVSGATTTLIANPSFSNNNLQNFVKMVDPDGGEWSRSLVDTLVTRFGKNTNYGPFGSRVPHLDAVMLLVSLGIPPVINEGTVAHVAKPGTPVHTIVSPKGVSRQPIIGGWTAEEAMNGGLISCAGRISRQEYIENPGVYEVGSTWYTFAQEDGSLMFVAEVNEPVPGDAEVEISGRGPQHLADQEIELIVYQDREYQAWTTPEGKLHGQGLAPDTAPTASIVGAGDVDAGDHRWRVTFVSADGETRAGPRSDILTIPSGGRDVQVSNIPTGPAWCIARKIYRNNGGAGGYSLVGTISDNSTTTFLDSVADVDLGDSLTDGFSANEIEAIVGQKRAKFHVSRGSSLVAGQLSSIVYWAPRENLTHIAFTINKTRDADNYEIRVGQGDGPDGSISNVVTVPLDESGAIKVSQALPGNNDMVRISLRRTTTQDNADPLTVFLTELRVNGIGHEDELNASAVVRDVCSRLGVSDDLVSVSGRNVLPLVARNITFRDILDYMSLVSNRRWLFLPKGLKDVVCDFDDFFSTVWTVPDPECARQLLGLERFNRGAVPYKYAEGKATDIVYARADPDPFPDSIRTAPPLELQEPFPNKDNARELAQDVADYHARRKYGGTITFAEVLDQNGTRIGCHVVRAGHSLYIPDLGLILPIAELSREETVCTARFLESYAGVDRMAARRLQQQAMRGVASVL